MSHLPWQTLSTKIVYENLWIKIHEDKVIRPDGKEGLYAFLSKPAAVFILAKSQDGFFILFVSIVILSKNIFMNFLPELLINKVI